VASILCVPSICAPSWSKDIIYIQDTFLETFSTLFLFYWRLRLSSSVRCQSLMLEFRPSGTILPVGHIPRCKRTKFSVGTVILSWRIKETLKEWDFASTTFPCNRDLETKVWFPTDINSKICTAPYLQNPTKGSYWCWLLTEKFWNCFRRWIHGISFQRGWFLTWL
jgi:hypothetical protein